MCTCHCDIRYIDVYIIAYNLINLEKELIMHVMALSPCNDKQNKYIWVKFNLLSGFCLYLKTKGSYVDAYNCSHFIDGCPNTSYKRRRIFDCKYSN